MHRISNSIADTSTIPVQTMLSEDFLDCMLFRSCARGVSGVASYITINEQLQ